MASTTTQNQQSNKRFIRQTVLETIGEIFNDPDYGLPLTPQTIQRLKKSIKSKRAGKLIDFGEVFSN